MYNLEILQGYFQESSMAKLEEIFSAASKRPTEAALKVLKMELLAVLEQEKNLGVMDRASSPSGNNHVIVVDSQCIIINLQGIHLIRDDLLFCEGELAMLNFQWIEEDNLVLFDLYWIVHDDTERIVCHYAEPDFFVYRILPQKVCNIPPIREPIDLGEDTEKPWDVFGW